MFVFEYRKIEFNIYKSLFRMFAYGSISGFKQFYMEYSLVECSDCYYYLQGVLGCVTSIKVKQQIKCNVSGRLYAIGRVQGLF